ncbi:alkaline phosphatase family protein [Bacillus sp. FJAT-27251]|uniref:alkaline phosphatase family protein n=1 Tax=Bacillus sp. FJAT-27251 TaxID=1684142 RepID=UPI000A73CB03|nr:alkaline phosphatase family protein [Bacillus sp. FJAT-27251]
MRKKYIIVICLSMVFSLAPGAFAKEHDNKVILLSVDGMRNDLTLQYMQEGILPHIQSLADSGIAAVHSSTVSPSLTAPSHAAMATGALPSETGMVSNKWQDPEEPLARKENAFKENLDKIPLWTEARKSGKVTATVLFPGANPSADEKGDYSVYYGKTWSGHSYEKLSFEPAGQLDSVPKSFSPVMEAKIPVQLKDAPNLHLSLVAVDTIDDSEKKYDTFILRSAEELDKDTVHTTNQEWGAFPLKIKDENTGFWYKVKANENLEESYFYRTEIKSAVFGGPEEFEEEIIHQFGFFPVQEDVEAFEEGWITRKEYEEIGARFAEWVSDVTLHIKDKYRPDLLMAYIPHIDHESHHFLLEDPRQPGYSKEKSAEYMNYVKWSYRVADSIVGRMAKSLGENDHFLLASDHGMEPVHSILAPNQLLKDKGYLKIDSDGQINKEHSDAYAVASGSAAQVYLNKNLADKEKEKLKKELVSLFEKFSLVAPISLKGVGYDFKAISDSVSGKSLQSFKDKTNHFFTYLPGSRIYPYEIVTAAKAVTSHPNAGELLLMAAPGYMMGSKLSDPVQPTKELGSHGGDPGRKELQAVFMATGPAIKTNAIIGPVSTLDIAPTVYHLLGLPAPSFIEGQVIKEALQKDK